MKYIIYIDYRVNRVPNSEYRTMVAKNFKEAIEEAEKIYNSKTMYLIQIMEKEGKIYKENGYKVENYRAVECKRSPEGGWHANDNENSESEHFVRRLYCKDYDLYDIVNAE